MNIGIKGIGYYIPENRISNLKRMEMFSIDKNFIDSKIGFVSVARKESNEKSSDLAVKAINDLKNRTGISLSCIECIALVTQNPDLRIPHTSAIVHNKLKLSERCVVFDISLGCSGFVHGLSILKSFMIQNGFTNGLLLTSDPYSECINDELDRDTSILFGDGAAATWLAADQYEWDIGNFDFLTISTGFDSLRLDDDNKLKMNGRDVFNFALKYVPTSINNTLFKNNIEKTHVDKYILHQGSKYIAEKILSKINVEDVDGFYAYNYGNLVSSSIPVILADLNSIYKTLLICGFGVGLSCSSVILKKHLNSEV